MQEDMTPEEMKTEMKVREYALWARQSGICLGYKPPPSVIRKSGATPDITDEEALVVEKALQEIRMGSGRDFKILWRSHIVGDEDWEISAYFRSHNIPLSEARVKTLRQAAFRAWFFCWRGLLKSAA